MIPFLVGAAVLVGGAKTVSALDDMSTAKSINNEAKKIAENADERLKNVKESTNNAIAELGKTKIGIMSGSMKHFVDSFSQIRNVDFKDSVGLDELRGFNPNSEEFKNLKNASLAAGGLGMAGVTAVLGGLVAAPALLITGFFLGSKAETALNDARANRDKARKYEQEIKNLCSTLDAIKSRANQIDNVLAELNKKFYPAISKLNDAVDFCGYDYRSYPPKARDAVMLSAQLAKTIKIVMDTSLLTEKGTLNDYETRQAIEKGQAALVKL